MSKEKLFVVYKVYAGVTEYLCETKPHHLYTCDIAKAKMFTEKQAYAIVLPLKRDSYRYRGYSIYGWGRK